MRLTYLVDGETTTRQAEISVASRSRATVAIHDEPAGLPRGKRFGLIVESRNGVAVVAERPIYFRYQPAWEPLGVTGGHTTLGASAAGPIWLFAEGYTGDGFDEELIIMNPQASAADVTIEYHLPNGVLARRGLRLNAGRRAVVQVHSLNQGIGRGWPVAAAITTTNPGGVVAERAIYFRYGADVDGGHVVTGFTGVDD